MEDSGPQEKRAIRRFTLQLPLTVTTNSGGPMQAMAESRDVSSHGICFYCDAVLEPESAIEFTLTLPPAITMTEALQVRCSGRVVRVERGNDAGNFAVSAVINNYEFVPNDQNCKEMTAGADAPPAV